MTGVDLKDPGLGGFQGESQETREARASAWEAALALVREEGPSGAAEQLG